MDLSFTITLPSKDGTQKEIHTNGSLLFVGANGSGKTRLGAWIEFNSPQREKVHRISAQKSLTMPDDISPISIDKAEMDLLYGNANAQINQAFQYKQGHRWQHKPAIALLNDYQKLMVYLFSDHYEKSAEYLNESKQTNERVEPPTTKLDIVKQIWEHALPLRELIIGGSRIQTAIKANHEKPYSAAEMSDGERVIFYLIGQCLAAPDHGIIVIDEPELHLHKSIQSPLWSAIERIRPDCLFIYLTHDVDFSASQKTSKKIWLKEYDGNNWDWEEIELMDDFPEDLLIEILGSRKPTLFVEGDNSSFDLSLYRAIFPDYLVIPRGSCTQVIQSVKVLKANVQLHHMDVFGIIDRDRRLDGELASLNSKGIFVLDVAEIENIFCVPEIIELVCANLELQFEETLRKVKDYAFSALRNEIEMQISLRVMSEIKSKLNLLDDKAKGKQNINTALDNLRKSIDVYSIYTETERLFNTVIDNQDYSELLKIYNRKSLSSQISSVLGISSGELPEYVLRMCRGEKVEQIRKALSPYFQGFFNEMVRVK